MTKTKILLFDIETSPLISYTWGLWEQNVIDVKQEWFIMSVAWKWLGEKTTHVEALPDLDLYKKDRTNDLGLIIKLHELFDEADIIIGHNGDQFDIKKVQSRFLYHKMKPVSPFKTIDTLKIARKYFKFDSNKLNYLSKVLGIGQKVKTGGFDLWLDCLSGDKKAWSLMKTYNKQDVVLLEKVYLKLRPWMTSGTKININKYECQSCGSSKIQRRGPSVCGGGIIRQRLQCQECGKWSLGELIKQECQK